MVLAEVVIHYDTNRPATRSLHCLRAHARQPPVEVAMIALIARIDYRLALNEALRCL